MMYNEYVKIQQIRKMLKHHYRALKISSKEDQMDNEVTLAKFGFKGRCKNCGAFVHKAAKCPEKKKENQMTDKKDNKIKIKGKGFNCGKEGHHVLIVDTRKRTRTSTQETLLLEKYQRLTTQWLPMFQSLLRWHTNVWCQKKK